MMHATKAPRLNPFDIEFPLASGCWALKGSHRRWICSESFPRSLLRTSSYGALSIAACDPTERFGEYFELGGLN